MTTIYATLGTVIYLGQVGEHKATSVAFDVTELRKQYPQGTATVIVERENEIYHALCYNSGTKVYTSEEKKYEVGHYYFRDIENPGRIFYFDLLEDTTGEFYYDSSSAENFFSAFIKTEENQQKQIPLSYKLYSSLTSNTSEVIIPDNQGVSITYKEITLNTENASNTNRYFIWEILNTDLQKAYKGQCHLIFSDGKAVVKSEHYQTLVTEMMRTGSIEIPEDTLDDYLAEIQKGVGYIMNGMAAVENSEQKADEYSDKAEAWAVGTKDGVEISVPATNATENPHKENNSKYWANKSHSFSTSSQNSATLAKSYARGDTGTREGESKDNAMYYMEQSKKWSNNAYSHANNAQSYMDTTNGYMNLTNGYMTNAQSYMDTTNEYMNLTNGYMNLTNSYMINTQSYMDTTNGYMNLTNGYMTNAQSYMDTTNEWKRVAEAWAIGKKDKVDVGSTEEQYQNNSKWWAEQAKEASQFAPKIINGKWHTWDTTLNDGEGGYKNENIPAALSITRSYPDESSLFNAAPEVEPFELAIIDANVNNLENSQLYVRNEKDADTAGSYKDCWDFLSDLSGIQGVSISEILERDSLNGKATYRMYFTGEVAGTKKDDKGYYYEFDLKDAVGFDKFESPKEPGQWGALDTYTITWTDKTTSTIKLQNGVKIESITRTKQDPLTLIDTYTIKDTLGEKDYTFEVKNGKGIVNITGPTSNKNIDTYTINYNDKTTSNYTVTNGIGISSISDTDVTHINGQLDTYTINFDHGLLPGKEFKVYNGLNGIDVSEIKVPDVVAQPNTTDTYYLVRSRNSQLIDETPLKVYNGKDGANAITIREWTISE